MGFFKATFAMLLYLYAFISELKVFFSYCLYVAFQNWFDSLVEKFNLGNVMLDLKLTNCNKP